MLINIKLHGILETNKVNGQKHDLSLFNAYSSKLLINLNK